MKKQTAIVRTEADRKHVLDVIAAVSLDLPLQIEWQTYRKKRSLSQNNLMWMWINELVDKVSDDTGHTPQEIHDYFKKQFLTPKIVEMFGETIEIRTTTTLKTDEMHDYMEHVYQWAIGQGYYLPVPEDLARAR